MVTTKLDVVTLQKIAYETGGKYYLASTGEAELDDIYAEISKMEKKELSSKRFSQYEDRFQIFLLLGMLLIVAELLIPEGKRVKREWAPMRLIIPISLSNPLILDKSRMESRIIGRSVISGAMEILRPSFVPCLSVSVNTRVINGPGVNPAPSPNMIPMRK